MKFSTGFVAIRVGFTMLKMQSKATFSVHFHHSRFYILALRAKTESFVSGVMYSRTMES